MRLDVPSAPDACRVCPNSQFVDNVLGELEAVLAEAREYQGRLQQLSSQVLTAHEVERKRIARELHDDTAQALTSILVRLRLLERSTEDEAVRRNAEELRELTASALASVRRMAVDLRPAALDDLGLVPALHAYAEKYGQSWPVKVTVRAWGIRRRLPPNVELVFYRVAQEALTNVAKHSSAGTAELAIARRSNTLTMTIKDDGVGFAAGEQLDLAGLLANRHYGLVGMFERAGLIGAQVKVSSTLGSGTQVHITWDSG